MRSIFLLCISMLICCVAQATADGDVWGPKPKPKKGKKRYKIPTYSNSTIETRLAELGYDFDLQYNKHVKKFIKSYVVRGRKGTEVILGRTATYLPIFQQYLEEYKLPLELQYLAIVE